MLAPRMGCQNSLFIYTRDLVRFTFITVAYIWKKHMTKISDSGSPCSKDVYRCSRTPFFVYLRENDNNTDFPGQRYIQSVYEGAMGRGKDCPSGLWLLLIPVEGLSLKAGLVSGPQEVREKYIGVLQIPA